MADIRSCKRCGRVFTDYKGKHLCSVCLSMEEDIFYKVRDYIREHDDATIFSTSRDCEVSELQIRKWLKEERITYKNPQGSGLYCEKCNAPIVSGRYCEKCKNNLAKELTQIIKISEPKPEHKKVEHEGNRMRFLNKVK